MEFPLWHTQWVKNPTAAAWVTVEVQVRSSAWCSGLKDPVLLQLWLRFSLWPGTSMCGRCGHKKKKKRRGAVLTILAVERQSGLPQDGVSRPPLEVATQSKAPFH